jgi:hypothetical protein
MPVVRPGRVRVSFLWVAKRMTPVKDGGCGLLDFNPQAYDKAHWIEAGRCYERFALLATTLGIRNALVNQPVEVAAIRPLFAAALGLGRLHLAGHDLGGGIAQIIVRERQLGEARGGLDDEPGANQRPEHAVVAGELEVVRLRQLELLTDTHRAALRVAELRGAKNEFCGGVCCAHGVEHGRQIYAEF